MRAFPDEPAAALITPTIGQCRAFKQACRVGKLNACASAWAETVSNQCAPRHDRAFSGKNALIKRPVAANSLE